MSPLHFLFFAWPYSQSVMGVKGAELVDPFQGDEEAYECLDSSYMVPAEAVFDESLSMDDPDGKHIIEARNKFFGEFIQVAFPDSQAHEEDDGVLYDYDGNCSIPVNTE